MSITHGLGLLILGLLVTGGFLAVVAWADGDNHTPDRPQSALDDFINSQNQQL